MASISNILLIAGLIAIATVNSNGISLLPHKYIGNDQQKQQQELRNTDSPFASPIEQQRLELDSVKGAPLVQRQQDQQQLELDSVKGAPLVQRQQDQQQLELDSVKGAPLVQRQQDQQQQPEQYEGAHNFKNFFANIKTKSLFPKPNGQTLGTSYLSDLSNGAPAITQHQYLPPAVYIGKGQYSTMTDEDLERHLTRVLDAYNREKEARIMALHQPFPSVYYNTNYQTPAQVQQHQQQIKVQYLEPHRLNPHGPIKSPAQLLRENGPPIVSVKPEQQQRLSEPGLRWPSKAMSQQTSERNTKLQSEVKGFAPFRQEEAPSQQQEQDEDYEFFDPVGKLSKIKQSIQQFAERAKEKLFSRQQQQLPGQELPQIEDHTQLIGVKGASPQQAAPVLPVYAPQKEQQQFGQQDQSTYELLDPKAKLNKIKQLAERARTIVFHHQEPHQLQQQGPSPQQIEQEAQIEQQKVEQVEQVEQEEQVEEEHRVKGVKGDENEAVEEELNTQQQQQMEYPAQSFIQRPTASLLIIQQQNPAYLPPTTISSYQSPPVDVHRQVETSYVAPTTKTDQQQVIAQPKEQQLQQGKGLTALKRLKYPKSEKTKSIQYNYNIEQIQAPARQPLLPLLKAPSAQVAITEPIIEQQKQETTKYEANESFEVKDSVRSPIEQQQQQHYVEQPFFDENSQQQPDREKPTNDGFGDSSQSSDFNRLAWRPVQPQPELIHDYKQSDGGKKSRLAPQRRPFFYNESEPAVEQEMEQTAPIHQQQQQTLSEDSQLDHSQNQQHHQEQIREEPHHLEQQKIIQEQRKEESSQQPFEQQQQPEREQVREVSQQQKEPASIEHHQHQLRPYWNPVRGEQQQVHREESKNQQSPGFDSIIDSLSSPQKRNQPDDFDGHVPQQQQRERGL